MSNPDRISLAEADRLWQCGHALEAGRLVFGAVPRAERPQWAAGILRFAISSNGGTPTAIRPVLRIADNPQHWHEAKSVFSALRSTVLDLERRPTRSVQQELLLCQLYLAENVAKVIYNATRPLDEFDEDSGDWVVACLKSVLDLLQDDKLPQAAWAVVCRNA
jgi:hypothetical protein